MRLFYFFRLRNLLLVNLIVLSSCSILPHKKKAETKIRALLIDGQSINHDHWKEWSPVLLKELDDSDLFIADILTAPSKGESLDKFNPDFKNYDVVITTYCGDNWSARAKRNLENYIKKGGGLVVVHAADNAFPQWPEYNKMIGLGGWLGRSEKDGPYVYVNDKQEIVRDNSPGKAGHHGDKHEFLIKTYQPEHPIMKDLPEKWLHTEDELYDQLRGPAENMEILATAYSSEEYKGTSRNEPVLMAITYEKGRIFHTTLGHSKAALSCVGFMTTFVRGSEWAASGKTTFPVPGDFPTADKTSSRVY